MPSVVTVDAAVLKLRLWNSDGSDVYETSYSLPEGAAADTWTFACTGKDLSDWGVINNNGEVCFVPWIDYDNQDYAHCESNTGYYSSSGESYYFRKNISGDRSGTVKLPSLSQSMVYTFDMYDFDVNGTGAGVRVKVTWTEGIQLMSDHDSDNIFTGATSDGFSNGEYTWTWTASDLSGKQTGDDLFFYLHNNSNNVSYGAYDGGADMTNFTTDGGWYGCKYATTDKFKITYAEGSKYTIKAKIENSKWKVNLFTHVKLKSTLDSWRGTDYESGSNGVYTWSWTKTQLNGLAEGTKLEFNLLQGTTTYGAFEGEVDMTNFTNNDDGWYTCHNTDYHFSITYSKGNTYVIQAKNENGAWKVKVITNAVDHYYYWVSPQVTNNQKLEHFKMVASRNRSGVYGDGKPSDKYFTFTIKDDDLKKWDGTAFSNGDKVQWYIVRDDNYYWYRPLDEDKDHGSDPGTRPRLENVKYGDDYLTYDADFYSYNFTNIGTSTNTDYCFSFNKGTGRSYTFVLNSKPSSGTGNVFIDSPADFPTTSNNTDPEFYLIGNFENASVEGGISIDNETKPMHKLWYKDNGTPYDYYVENADSVVYWYKVSKPDGGWGNLYLDVNPRGNRDWRQVYRPLLSLYNNIDGRALVGGLTQSGWGNLDGVNGDQSFNPEPSDFYSGYTFRFNATTMTYHLQFHSSLYLVGDAVSADGKQSGWDLTYDDENPSAVSDKLIPLEATQDERHFRKKVTLKKGCGFRFLQKEDENKDAPYARNWGEDTFAPGFSSLGETDPHYAGTDTQYRNYVQYNTTNTSSTDNPAADGSANIVFDLPDGDYVINFYNYDHPYYTIEREAELRDFEDVWYLGNKRVITGRGGYNFFRVWSDYIAWNKPDDVDVYTVTAFNPSGMHTATVTLTKQDVNYIPANTGVILAMKTDKNSLKGGMYYDEVVDKTNNTGYNNAWMQMTPYTEPGATLDSKGELKPLYEATDLQRYEGEGETGKANYLFGFYHTNHVIAGNQHPDNEFLLGFWLTTGIGKTYANSAFLQLTRAQSDALGVGASYTVSDGGNNAPAFLLLFEDIDATVTGITDMEVQTPARQTVDDHWYTLTGVRINAPSTRGIYIHAGKKVIVK